MTALLVCFLQMLADVGAPITVTPSGAITFSATAPAPNPGAPNADGSSKHDSLEGLAPSTPSQISNGF